MTLNGNLCQTDFSELGNLPKKRSITELQAALACLDGVKGNVQNCNCAPSNCCQSAACQSCQSQTCQSECKGGDCFSH